MIRVPKARAGFPGGKPAAGNPTRLIDLEDIHILDIGHGDADD